MSIVVLDSEYLYDSAKTALGIGEIDKAIEYLQIARDLDPQDAKILSFLGNLYTNEKHNFDKAKQCFEECLKLEVNDSEVYQNLGSGLSKLGEHHKAIRYFSLSIHNENDYDIIHKTYCNLALEYIALNNNLEAIKYFKLALRIKPNDTETIESMAESYKALNRSEDFKDFAKKIINENEDYSSLFSYLGIVEAEINKSYELPIQYFNAAILTNPKDASLYHNLAVTHFRNHNYGLVLDTFKRALDEDISLTNKFYESEIIFDAKVDFKTLEDLMKYAADKGDENATKWLIENSENFELHISSNRTKVDDFTFDRGNLATDQRSYSKLKLITFNDAESNLNREEK